MSEKLQNILKSCQIEVVLTYRTNTVIKLKALVSNVTC